MTKDDIAVMEELLQAGQDGDMEKLTELTHEDCVIHEPESLPYGGDYTGETAIPDIHADIADVWDEFDYDKGQLFDGGDRVFTLFQVVAESSGETLEMPLVEIYQLEDGQVKEVDVFYQDTAAILETLGKIPTVSG